MIGNLDHPTKNSTLEIMHNCPDVFEKMFGQCKHVKLTDIMIKHGHFEPAANGCFTLVQN